jgi:hypothetical protein
MAIVQNLKTPDILVFTSKYCRSYNCIFRLIPLHNIQHVYVCIYTYIHSIYIIYTYTHYIYIHIYTIHIYIHTVYIYNYVQKEYHNQIRRLQIWIWILVESHVSTSDLSEGWPHRVVVTVRCVQPSLGWGIEWFFWQIWHQIWGLTMFNRFQTFADIIDKWRWLTSWWT